MKVKMTVAMTKQWRQWWLAEQTEQHPQFSQRIVYHTYRKL